jgi:hypothetical protein
MPRVTRPQKKRMGRPPKPKHIPLDAIDFGSADDDEMELAPRVPWKSKVQIALASLDEIDRHVLIQQVLREMVRDQPLAR